MFRKAGNLHEIKLIVVLFGTAAAATTTKQRKTECETGFRNGGVCVKQGQKEMCKIGAEGDEKNVGEQ